jgi:hypothetical protein
MGNPSLPMTENWPFETTASGKAPGSSFFPVSDGISPEAEGACFAYILFIPYF